MSNELQKTLNAVRATEKLKHSTNAFLHSEIRKRNRHPRAVIRYAMACCCLFAVLLCGFGGYSAYSSPVSYISVDVNPSIELALNRFKHVISVKAYNEDGLMVMQNLKLINHLYTDALETLLADETFMEYLSADSVLSFTVVSPDEETLLAGIRQCSGYVQYGGECHGANENTAKAAHHSGVSVGRYGMYEKLSKYDKTITVEDCRTLSMRQLKDLLIKYSDMQREDGDREHGKGHHGGGRGKKQ